MAYQDCAPSGPRLVCGGHRAGRGMIDVIDPERPRVVRRVPVGRTQGGRLLTREGRNLHRGRLFLLPEDGAEAGVFTAPWGGALGRPGR